MISCSEESDRLHNKTDSLLLSTSVQLITEEQKEHKNCVDFLMEKLHKLCFENTNKKNYWVITSCWTVVLKSRTIGQMDRLKKLHNYECVNAGNIKVAFEDVGMKEIRNILSINSFYNKIQSLDFCFAIHYLIK